MPSAILLAEKAGQALQTQLLRLNEFMGNTHLTCRVKKKKKGSGSFGCGSGLFFCCLPLQTCHLTSLFKPTWPKTTPLQVRHKTSFPVVCTANKKGTKRVDQRVSVCACVCAGDDVEEVELHGKLEDDRFLFSLENNSAACDVLDLREVLSLFVKEG